MGPGKGGRGKTGERRCRSFFSLALASGPLEYLWKYGMGPSCNEEADPSGELLDNGCRYAAGRDALRAEERLVRMSGSEGMFGDTRAAMPEGLVGLPDACCLMVGPERRGEAGRSETRAGILRLGNALAGKADAVQGGCMACSGLCQACPVVEIARVELSPRSSFRAGGGPQDAKKPSMWRALSFPMGGQASGTVLGRAHGHVCHWAGMPYRLKKWLEREALWEGASRLMREKPLPPMFVYGRF